MFVRRWRSIVFFVMCFTLVVSFKVLAQGTPGNETALPAVVENKVETPSAPVVSPEPAVQAAAAVTPAVPETPVAVPVVPASPEETTAPVANAEKAQVVAVPAAASEKKTEWVWGEVVSVDPAAKQIVVKHLDYESYEEVQTVLLINEKTLFENVTDLTGIKAGDHITVDYNIDGKNNTADLVVVEKGEAVPQGSVGEKPAETPEGASTMGSAPQENANMTAAPETAKPVAPEAAGPVAVANEIPAANATETPAQ